jgi:hypothetical protein
MYINTGAIIAIIIALGASIITMIIYWKEVNRLTRLNTHLRDRMQWMREKYESNYQGAE